jgi:ADP-ribosyl-[dinitrogen reductase] hydrolase
MTTTQDRATGVLLGLAAGDRIGGPLRMALCLAESLLNQLKFDSQHVFETYHTWYLNGGFDTGPTTARVFKQVSQGLSVVDAVALVDKQSQGLTAGCNPMHRAIPLTLAPFISDDELAEIARQDAKLTHFHPLAGDVSAATVMLCRKLIHGENLEAALNSINIENWLDRPLSNSGFAPDVFHAAVHFVRESNSFQTALGNALGFAGADNYCPVVVGALAGAVYGASQIPASTLKHCKIIESVNQINHRFVEEY